MAEKMPEEDLQLAESKHPEPVSDGKRHHDEIGSKDEESGDKVSDNLGTGEPVRKVRKSTEKSDVHEAAKQDDTAATATDASTATASGSNEKIIADIGPFVAADKLEAQSGDMIEIQRGFYSHWGIYTTDGYLIHITGNSGDIATKEAECQKKLVTEIAGVSMVRVNNLTKQAGLRNLKALDKETILKNAHLNVGKMVPYNLLQRNCEHYVTEWRYGKGWSSQVDVGFALISKQKTESLLSTLAKSLEKGDTANKQDTEPEAEDEKDDTPKAEEAVTQE